MVRWKNWLGSSEDATEGGVLEMLHDLEQTGVRMIHGRFHFVWVMIPRFFRKLLQWIRRACEYCIRVAVRLVRVAAVFAAWLVIVFLPLALFPGIPAGAWVALALVGSIWGVLRHQRKMRAKRVTPPKMPTQYIRV